MIGGNNRNTNRRTELGIPLVRGDIVNQSVLGAPVDDVAQGYRS